MAEMFAEMFPLCSHTRGNMHSCTILIIQHDEYSGQMPRVDRSSQKFAAHWGTCLRECSRVHFSSADSSRVQQALESELVSASFKPIVISFCLIKLKAVTPCDGSQRCLRFRLSYQFTIQCISFLTLLDHRGRFSPFPRETRL